jgi:lysophospholipase L1-like esterase
VKVNPVILSIIFLCSCLKNKDVMPSSQVVNKYYYLALGDSYTIGEMVSPLENFPTQVTLLMRNETTDFQSARIIARTGWTTEELETGITEANAAEPLRNSYDFVSLLIGVNNQYRGRTVDSYRISFEELLKKAIRFAGNRPERVIVLSIPDWGVTPFANGRDRAQIAREIDAYNDANKQITKFYNVHYLDITPWTREAARDLSLLTSDGLHPSAKEYKRWAEKISLFFRSKL